MSISYLRCLIEHVRCYILDRDIELIYYTIRKSSDVLTRDSMQLGAQVIDFTNIQLLIHLISITIFPGYAVVRSIQIILLVVVIVIDTMDGNCLGCF